MINFYPHFLPGLSAGLEPLLTALLFGRRLTSVSFFRQLMCNKSLAVDSAMKKSSLCNLVGNPPTTTNFFIIFLPRQ